jgi:hypothetical protein
MRVGWQPKVSLAACSHRASTAVHTSAVWPFIFPWRRAGLKARFLACLVATRILSAVNFAQMSGGKSEELRPTC